MEGNILKITLSFCCNFIFYIPFLEVNQTWQLTLFLQCATYEHAAVTSWYSDFCSAEHYFTTTLDYDFEFSPVCESYYFVGRVDKMKGKQIWQGPIRS